MNSYVLILSVGPVQGFIASARRSRDLWAGSWLLSEIAKAAAQSLLNSGAEMIFPHAEENKLPENVGNKIQVIIKNKSQEELLNIAEEAKKATEDFFVKQADDVFEKIGKQLRQELWDNQKNDYVEVQYAWAKMADEKEYVSASQKAAAMLAARKATRDFAPSLNKVNLPKSSLDGARETVLPEKNSSLLRKKLGLSQSEQLDCAGVVKRLCGNPEQFTAITRVAAESWIAEVKHHADFEQVKQAYEELVKNGLATRVLGNHQIYADFPYDAQFLYPARLQAAYPNCDDADKPLLDNLKYALKAIWKAHGEPCPYFAMLLADGDRMGELLDKAEKIEHHQSITKNLSAFAEGVPQTMQKHQAQCIYAGGDDVLGLVPLNQALKCAEALAEKFSASLKPVADGLGAENPPTLSVGLAICHINTPLGNIRALAKRAEKEAKGDKYPKKTQRNALGITLAVRGGATVDMRLRWDDTSALEKFRFWQQAYQEKTISSRIAYDCREIFTATDFPTPRDEALLEKIRMAELMRMLEKARTHDGKKIDAVVKTELENRLNALQDLNALATELIIARWLAAKTQRDLGREHS